MLSQAPGMLKKAETVRAAAASGKRPVAAHHECQTEQSAQPGKEDNLGTNTDEDVELTAVAIPLKNVTRVVRERLAHAQSPSASRVASSPCPPRSHCSSSPCPSASASGSPSAAPPSGSVAAAQCSLSPRLTSSSLLASSASARSSLAQSQDEEPVHPPGSSHASQQTLQDGGEEARKSLDSGRRQRENGEARSEASKGADERERDGGGELNRRGKEREPLLGAEEVICIHASSGSDDGASPTEAEASLSSSRRGPAASWPSAKAASPPLARTASAASAANLDTGPAWVPAGDLTDFLLHNLQLISTKYEEQGEAWRATGFRVAVGAIRQSSGKAARVAELARRQAAVTAASEEAAASANASGPPTSLSGAASPSSLAAASASPLARLRREGITRANYTLLKDEPGVGASIFQTIEELVLTGTASRLQVLLHGDRAKALADLQRIWGVGFHTAEKLFSLGVHSVADLRRAVELTDAEEAPTAPDPLEEEAEGRSGREGDEDGEAGDAAGAGLSTDAGAGAGMRRCTNQLLEKLFGVARLEPYLSSGTAATKRRKVRAGATQGNPARRPAIGGAWLPGEREGERLPLNDGPPREAPRGASGRGGEDTIARRRRQEAARLLSRPQRLGLKYVEAFQKRIPHEEVAAIASYIRREIGLDPPADSRAKQEPGGGAAKAEALADNAAGEARVKHEPAKTRADEEEAGGDIGDEERRAAQCKRAWANCFVAMDVCGSYRRGKAECGDIDILIIRRNDQPRGALKDLIARLAACGLLCDNLLVNELLSPPLSARTSPERAQGGDAPKTTRGKGAAQRSLNPVDAPGASDSRGEDAPDARGMMLRKSVSELYCGVCVWPPRPACGAGRNAGADAFVGPSLPRRIDIKIYPERCHAYALLYFTGSAQFNRSMRAWAKRINYSLDDTGLYSRLTMPAAVPSAARAVRQRQARGERAPERDKQEPEARGSEAEAEDEEASLEEPEDADGPAQVKKEGAEGGAVDGGKVAFPADKEEKKSAFDRAYWRRMLKPAQRPASGIVWKARRGLYCETEEEIFDALELQYMPPEDREVFVEPKGGVTSLDLSEEDEYSESRE
ncbi:hypothetical protein BESB_021190 [Besnoitia besnoiti]|uniref:DNA-directed DNA polymerase X domain-containing protein n=1 Tax=Besnoitia besnoiti TaxID=94643 RepID=A0A2A9M0U5_BESBE|nr:hypothetical protein BESB_021190 [Besnoitia besnoiti]PFH32178.1 hypothetical protein BESB_021190 [Besnoitia besnoiti]